MESTSSRLLVSGFDRLLPNHEPVKSWSNPNPEQINPYEPGAVSNYPGGSNILYIPGDFYFTIKALVESVKHSDNEEIVDATTRLVGIPVNAVSATGIITGYGVGFGFISHIPWYLTPITMIMGIVLCIVEGLVDIVSLIRQNRFENKFDFELLSHLRNMVADIDPSKTAEAVKGITKLINNAPESLNRLLGKDRAELVKNLMNKIQSEIKAAPQLQTTIINHHMATLEEVARQLLVKNLLKMRNDYLQISGEEKSKIDERVKVKNPNKTPEEQRELINKELEITSMIKKKQLARRIRPWMVEEANKTINPLLQGIVENDSEAIHEGLRLSDDIHTQSKKKKIVHILGIIVLAFAAASLIAIMVTCPSFIPFFLAEVALTLSLVRAGIFSGRLDSRGWTFEPKRLVPAFLQKKIFSNPPTTPEIRHKYQRSLAPEKERVKLIHTPCLDFKKRGFKAQPPINRDPTLQTHYIYV